MSISRVTDRSLCVLQAEADMRHKLELIHQIRAVESSPLPRQKMVDLTATAGARLLSEMSIAEVSEMVVDVVSVTELSEMVVDVVPITEVNVCH